MFSWKLSILLFTWDVVFGGEVDLTRQERQLGQPIVEAVIQQISQSEIFSDDHSFMLRLAFVESEFGKWNKTYREGYYGGIWQLDESSFKLTLEQNDSTKAHHQWIKEKFNIDWKEVTWDNLLQPFYSGLACRLYFAIQAEIHATSIPDTMFRQAQFWQSFYRNHDHDLTFRFKEMSAFLGRELRANMCHSKLDLMIAIDASTSVGRENFPDFIKNIANLVSHSFSPESSEIHLGAFLFTNMIYHLTDIDDDITMGMIGGYIELATFPFGDSRTDKALMYGTDALLKAPRNGVPQVVLIFQHGKVAPNSALKEAAFRASQANIAVYVVGIGNDVDTTELLSITNSQQRNVFTLTGFKSLSDFLPKFHSVFCNIPQKLSTLEMVIEDKVVQHEARYYIVNVSNADGITVYINVTNESGYVNAFWHYSFETPNRILYNGDIDGITHIPGSNTKQAFISVIGVSDNVNGSLYKIYFKDGNLDHDVESGSTIVLRSWVVGFAGILLAILSFE